MKNDIRFLVTKACNYNCYFCHREGVSDLIRKHELKVDDYVTLYRLHSRIEEWNGVTISGGEPFFYRDIDELIEKLYKEGAEITVVTNGSLLNSHIPVMKYVKRINVSIHTLNEQTYSKIINREEGKLYIVKENLQTLRALYPDLEIRLNVTPCKDQNWNVQELESVINYANQINATVKCTELFPNNQEDCIRVEELRESLESLGYYYVSTKQRVECFEKNHCYVFLTQCTCSKAIITDSPINYCRENHDIYVNYNATFSLCRLGTETIDFWEEIRENNFEVLEMKLKLARRRVSKEACSQYLKCVYF